MSLKSTEVKEEVVMDVPTLQRIIAKDAEKSDRMMIISRSKFGCGRTCNSDADMMKDVLSVIGEENVEDIEVMQKKFILITLHKGKENFLDSIRGIRHQGHYFKFHHVHPIKAHVEGTLTGIPRFVSSKNLNALRAEISKEIPFLSDITMEYIPVPGSPFNSNAIKVKAVVCNVMEFCEREQYQYSIQFCEFEGGIYLNPTGQVVKNETLEITKEVTGNIEVLGWGDEISFVFI